MGPHPGGLEKGAAGHHFRLFQEGGSRRRGLDFQVFLDFQVLRSGWDAPFLVAAEGRFFYERPG